MDKYFTTSPDEGSYFINISDLTETQQAFISQVEDTFGLDKEEYFEDGYSFKYSVDAVCWTENSAFSQICNYLLEEGFEDVTDCKK